MKLATFLTDGRQKIGAVVEDGAKIVDLRAAAGGGDAFDSMLALIQAGDGALDLARKAVERAPAGCVLETRNVKLLAPIPVPPQIRDAMTFPLHIRQAPVGLQKLAALLQGRPEPDIKPAETLPEVYRRHPVYYLTNRFSVIGTDETVRWPRYSKIMDFELEIAAIVGKGGKNIARKDAFGHIFGYTIFNDFSARDTQLGEMQGMLGPAKGKSFDMGSSFGPWIVTRDEIPDPKALKASARINGKSYVETDTSAMLYGFDELLAYISMDETLHPGEIIGSGTLGNGCGLERGKFLEDGDVVELEFERIGVLRNKVARQG